jgi:hypothetical protein
VAFHSVRHDDPFITYRYGQNFASAAGLTFNPGERVLGTTSPAHALISAGAYALVGRDATPTLMSALGCLAWTAQSVAAYYLLVETLGVGGALVVAASLQLGSALGYLWVPFETNWVAALLLGAFATAKRERFRWCALLTGLAVLMRPDALIAAGLLGALAMRAVGRRALLPIALGSALVLPWVAFAAFYYGTPVPQSAVQKFQRTPLADYFQHELKLFADTLLALWPQAPAAWMLPAAIAAAAFLLSAFSLARRDPFFAIVALYALAHWSAYLVLRPFIGHDWHLFPANLVGVVLVLAALTHATQRAPRAWARVLAGSALVLLVLAATTRTWQASQSYPSGYWTGERDAAYRLVSAYLLAHAQPGDHFASVEVGTIAYYTGMSAYDLGGLVTDLRRTNMVDRPVRWLVLDSQYQRVRPGWAPSFSTKQGDFAVHVYALPSRSSK